MTSRTLVRARAPLRVSFAGGGTDVPPFPADEGGLVLSATIARYAHATLRPRDDRQITLESLDYGMSVDFGMDEPMLFDGRLDLVKSAIRGCSTRSAAGSTCSCTPAPRPAPGSARRRR